MTAQRLDRTLTCFRIGDPDGTYPIFSAAGSRLYPGRWNTVDTPVIYASENYATAMLEKLVHGAGRLPPNQHFVTITVPRGATYEVVSKDHLLGWNSPEASVSRDHGAAWVRECRSLVLLVPSFVARLERNVVINPAHPDFGEIETGLAEPVWWDRRLFEG
ncbi:RES family NAD+ phosphorylase [Ferruginivarius sediminum]|uniref:RES domain-containing protein n=1 Tax=Ferruginivarius sediminum TaxID=2661937 RepID=A0A369T862_9PROT|nr:RES domain-containing protein [Ferruginivarius sediminum]RDD61503.1 hypothetical protein DRB17_12430 [Ferruginivarius sediminum]